MKPKLINFLNEVGKAQLAYVVHHLPVCKLNECRQLVKKLAVAMENYLLK